MESMTDYTALLKRLISLRQAAGESQQAIADHLGVVQSTVGNWESGRNRIPMDLAIAWARRYGHELVIAGAADQTAQLVAAAAELTTSQLEDLAIIAGGLPRLSPTIRATIIALIDQVADETKSARSA